MDRIFFELCAETVKAAIAGARGGANRIELCEKLVCGGVTPSMELIQAASQSLTIPLHILIRPRAGDFVYSASEFALMRRQIEFAKMAGASGIVVGVLLPNSRVDVIRCRELVELARPMTVVFHRAFDETRNLHEALEDVIETGADNLLTSGGAGNILLGAEQIAELQRLAGTRLHIVAGGGLRLDNLIEFVHRAGVFSLHGSLSRRNGELLPKPCLSDLESDTRQVIQLLSSEYHK